MIVVLSLLQVKDVVLLDLIVKEQQVFMLLLDQKVLVVLSTIVLVDQVTQLIHMVLHLQSMRQIILPHQQRVFLSISQVSLLDKILQLYLGLLVDLFLLLLSPVKVVLVLLDLLLLVPVLLQPTLSLLLEQEEPLQIALH